MNFHDWLDYGVEKNYCTEQYCATHDGAPMTIKEQQAWEDGDDPCCHVVRLGSPTDWDSNI